MNDSAVKRIGAGPNPPAADSESAREGRDTQYNRRAFLTGMGLGGAAFLLLPLRLPAAFAGSADDRIFCVGSFSADNSGMLHILRIRSGKVTILHAAPSARPSAMVVNPLRSLLHVANDVSRYEDRPRGTIETFSVDQETGALEFVGRCPLPLFATRPKSLALSPDGQSILVAAFGGAYSILPIDKSGLPGAPSCILKQVGQGRDWAEQGSAHPFHVLFHRKAGFAVAADYGADRLDVLLPDREESDAGKMKVTARVACAAGSGPREITIHRDGRLIVVSQSLRPALAAFAITAENQVAPIGEILLDTAPTSVCFHPERDVLYSAQNRGKGQAILAAWRVNPQKGIVRQIDKTTLPGGNVKAMYSESTMLWMTSDRGVIAVELIPESGKPRIARMVAAIPDARSLAVLRQS